MGEIGRERRGSGLFESEFSEKNERRVEWRDQNDEERLIIIDPKKVLKKCKIRPILQKRGGFGFDFEILPAWDFASC